MWVEGTSLPLHVQGSRLDRHISTKLTTFSCFKSFKMRISLRAVMGNCTVGSGQAHVVTVNMSALAHLVIRMY